MFSSVSRFLLPSLAIAFVITACTTHTRVLYTDRPHSVHPTEPTAPLAPSPEVPIPTQQPGGTSPSAAPTP